jgi:hypothetical protein
MGARDEVDYSSRSIEELCQLWDLAQRQRSKILTDELVAEFSRRSERPAETVHELPSWLTWLPRLFWHQKPSKAEGEGRT